MKLTKPLRQTEDNLSNQVRILLVKFCHHRLYTLSLSSVTSILTPLFSIFPLPSTDAFVNLVLRII